MSKVNLLNLQFKREMFHKLKKGLFIVPLYNRESTLSRIQVSFFALSCMMFSGGTERHQWHEMDQFSLGTSL